MRQLLNDPADFAAQAVAGFADAHPHLVRPVPGGVIRCGATPPGQVAVITGGGSGHYPAFAGWVGPGLAHGAVCGNIFASPSAEEVADVVRAADSGAGALLCFGNYAGDVLNFGLAGELLRAEGRDTAIVAVTDDIASAPPAEEARRRGIAGDLAVIKIAAAAAAAGADLDGVAAAARAANARTFTIGAAFSGCTLPGAAEPLFTVADGTVALGLGIHGEPGLEELPTPSADELVALMWDRLAAERPADADGRVVIMVNGLGATTHEELFVAARALGSPLAAAGLTVRDLVVGEQCTSLDMSGFSITVLWLDDKLEAGWFAPCTSAAFTRSGESHPDHRPSARPVPTRPAIERGGQESRALAARLLDALRDAERALADAETRLGELDAVAGDGDHGIGMRRGVRAALTAAEDAADAGAGAQTLARLAAAGWAREAGGTSGALWGAMLGAAAARLDDEAGADPGALDAAVAAAADALGRIGGARPGDKTMLDAVVPFAEAFAAATGTPRGRWNAAADAARDAAVATSDLVARRGRSRTHGERSVGTPDPGAVSFALVVATLAPHLPGEPTSSDDSEEQQ